MVIVRATIRRYDAGARTADVELQNGPAVLLAGVPVAAHLTAELLPAGARVWLILAEDGALSECLVLAV